MTELFVFVEVEWLKERFHWVTEACYSLVDNWDVIKEPVFLAKTLKWRIEQRRIYFNWICILPVSLCGIHYTLIILLWCSVRYKTLWNIIELLIILTIIHTNMNTDKLDEAIKTSIKSVRASLTVLNQIYSPDMYLTQCYWEAAS